MKVSLLSIKTLAFLGLGNNYIGGLTSTNNRSFHIFFFKSNDVEVLIAAINALENIL